MDTYGEVYIGWASQQLESLGLPKLLALDYAKAVAACFQGVTTDMKHADSLSRELKAEEVGLAFEPFKAAVSQFVDKLTALAAK